MKIIGKSAHQKRAEREVRRLREGIEKIIGIGPDFLTVDVVLEELGRLLEGPGAGDGSDQ